MPNQVGHASASAPCLFTWGMVYARTKQLALNAGRTSVEITQLDYEQAKHELTGVADTDQQFTILSGYE